MGHTALVLGDQLSHANPALEGADRVLMIESRAALTRLRYHRRRRHLVLSAMRHFAAELRAKGVEVDYRQSGTMAEALHGDIVCAAPNDAGARRRLSARRALRRFHPVPHRPGRIHCLGGDAAPRMEEFYRDQRRRLGVLMDGGTRGRPLELRHREPAPPREGLSARAPYRPREDAIDQAVRDDLDRWDLNSSARTDHGSSPPRTTRRGGCSTTSSSTGWPHFGTWQDAMVPGERWLFHSLLSSSLNLWLLDPLDAVRRAESGLPRRGRRR